MISTRILCDSGAPTIFHKYARAKVDGGGYMGSYIQNRHLDRYDWLDNPEYLAYRDQYVAYLKKHEHELEVYTNLDIVNNAEATWENQQYFEAQGLKPMPVWHFGSDVKWLKHYLRLGYTHLGIGGLVPNPYEVLRPALDDIFSKYLCDTDGMPLIKVHGFAATSIPLMCRYPWHCMSTNHEVLTKKGWKSYGEVAVGEEILCHDEDGNSIWQPIQEIFHYVNAPIVHIREQRFHAEVTPNHRWLLYNPKTGVRSFAQTDQLRSFKGFRIERFGEYKFPEHKMYSDDYVELAAWFFTDGSIRHRARYKTDSISLYQSQKINPTLCRRIRELLKRMNEPYYEHGSENVQWNVYGENSRKLLLEFPKKVPTWDFLFSLTEEQCDLFVLVCLLADGYSLKPGRELYGIGKRADKYAQTIHIIQTAMLLLKRPSSLRKEYGVSNNFDFSLCIQESAQDYISTEKFGTKTFPLIDRCQKTEGETWCVKVPSGAFYTRCNGYIYVTGNSVDSASWIKYAAFGGIMIPQKVKGELRYLLNPHKVNVSGKSPMQSKEGQHIRNLGHALKKHVLEYIEQNGFQLGESRFEDGKEIRVVDGLCNRPHLRCQLNALYYMGLRDQLPEWPWPFKAIVRNSLW